MTDTDTKLRGMKSDRPVCVGDILNSMDHRVVMCERVVLELFLLELQFSFKVALSVDSSQGHAALQQNNKYVLGFLLSIKNVHKLNHSPQSWIVAHYL